MSVAFCSCKSGWEVPGQLESGRRVASQPAVGSGRQIALWNLLAETNRMV